MTETVAIGVLTLLILSAVVVAAGALLRRKGF